MPKIKMKSNRGVAKRFKVTGTGKVRFKRAGKRHLLTSKSRHRKRQLNKTVTVSAADAWTLKRMIPGT